MTVIPPPTPSGVPPLPVSGPLTMTPVPKAGGSEHTVFTPFVDMMENMAKQTRDGLKHAEHMEKKAAIGQADPREVATTVVNARAMVQQFSGLLHSATAAYQEIMRIAL
jgi:flagellar hook-basal body complex protein FliE